MGRIPEDTPRPPTRVVPSALAIMLSSPVTKKPSYGPEFINVKTIIIVLSWLHVA